ncbi:MAG: MBL fold metallo-hydrolase [Solirubrobacterales bacterium]|nr:MBL fold metallo-hydrolase [Solirubrobacterales bacterium]
MVSRMTKTELGRGERVIPGLWRLRLPLPWPVVPHGNAYAIAAGDGLVLVDCGTNLEGSFEALTLALTQVDLSLKDVHTLVITHAHSDHWGQARTILDKTGAELWLNPNLAHARSAYGDPEQALQHHFEIGIQSGVPEAPLREFLEQHRGMPSGVDALLEPEHELVNGVSIPSDLGDLHVYETPGHAPSHVSLFNAEQRLLISGDTLLGRVSPYFDFGFSPDPLGEFLGSMDTLEALDARLCVSGHGRPFTDVRAHIDANRELLSQRLDAARAGLNHEPQTALELIPAVFSEPLTPGTATWRLPETLSYLTHLKRLGEASRAPDPASSASRWIAAQP